MTLFIADWTTRAVGVVADTDEHGFSNLSAFIPYSMAEAFRFYDAIPAAHIVLSDGAYIIWEGRIEDRRIVSNPPGLEVGCFGYWRAFYDMDYTCMWSTQSYTHFIEETVDDQSNRAPSKYIMRANDSIQISLRQGELYTTAVDIGAMFWRITGKSENDFNGASIDFDYDVTLPTNWQFRTKTYTSGFTTGTVEDTVTGNGSQQTGSKTLTGSHADGVILEFQIRNNTGSNYTNALESDDWYVKIDNLRIFTGTGASALYADEVASGIVSTVSTLNSSQLSSSTALIDSPTVDITDLIVEDTVPARVLIELTALGDDSTPPELYEVGVWEDQVLYFRQRGSAAQDWYINAADISIDSTLDTLFNSSYATYRDERGRTRRTATSDDDPSIDKYGLTRRFAARTSLSLAVTDTTLAQNIRDTMIERGKEITPRARLQVYGRIFDSSGSAYPAYHCRSGDTVSIRNLPISGGSTVDKIRKFTVNRTSFDVASRTMTITPELDFSDLGLMVAKGTKGSEGGFRGYTSDKPIGKDR
jgi:hypothetical protein